ncbi:MAG: cystathionine gamma-synthase [Cyclobacteriaceae bacterium]
MKFGTKVIHAGIEPDPTTGAIMTPIFQTSTYVQASPGDHQGYEYARTQNPTRSTLEKNLAALENGSHARCFASGMAAVDAVIKLLKPGDEVICTNDLYGGSYRIFTKVFANYGIKFHFVPMNDLARVKEKISGNTRMFWIETPTNPMMNVVDIRAIADLAQVQNAWTVVDNTFATPYLQNPLDLGADMVLHSITKYLGGHSDTVMGAVIVKDVSLDEQLGFLQNSCGAVPGPQDCFLVLRGIKTLHVRMQRHCENGHKVAEYLANHAKVDRIYYPGLETSEGYEVARRQMRDFGGMLSFVLKGDSMEDAFRTLEKLKVFALAESLGGVESLAGHPASMTHASIPKEERMKTGLSDSLIRLSVGIEDSSDLINDLEQAIG